jgi:hypothetical protein
MLRSGRSSPIAAIDQLMFRSKVSLSVEEYVRCALAAVFISLAGCASERDPDAYLEVQFTEPEPYPGGAPGAMVVRSRPVTAYCNDGWLSYSPQQRGTCAGHGGVREWVNRPAE